VPTGGRIHHLDDRGEHYVTPQARWLRWQVPAGLREQAVTKSVALRLAKWTGPIPAEFREQAEEILVAAARAGADLRALAQICAAPGHDRPKRARAYLLSDEVVAATAAHYSHNRPRLDDVSRQAIYSASRPHAPSPDSGPAQANSPATGDAAETTDDALWSALCAAPQEGSRSRHWPRCCVGHHTKTPAMKGTRRHKPHKNEEQRIGIPPPLFGISIRRDYSKLKLSASAH
jgi:hypothetical protein